MKQSGWALFSWWLASCLAGVTGLLPGPGPARAAEPASVPASVPTYHHALLCEIYGEISDVTLKALEGHFQTAAQINADLVILKIDTYGGGLTSALEISQLIKHQNRPVIAWVNPRAISAGALIALACNQIVIAPHGLIGDCAPIVSGQKLEGVEREKYESPTRAEFRDSAQRGGYNVPLAMAMVTGSDGFYQVARVDDPAVRKIVPTEEMEQLTGKAVASQPGQTHVPDSERGKWKVVKVVLEPHQLLTMQGEEAVEYGFARALAGNEDSLKRALNITGPITSIAPSWSETLAIWLGSTTVRGFLMGLLVLSIWIAFQHPGHGLPEATALVLLALVLVPPYITGLANWMEIIMILAGLVLIAVEIFVLPGFGVAGVLGVILFFTGLVMTFVPLEPGRGVFSWPEMQQTWDHLTTGLLAVLASSVGGFFAGLLFMHYFPRTVLSRAAIPLNPTVAGDTVPGPFAHTVPSPSLPPETSVGEVGVAETDLRPSGKARIGKKLLDVVAVGQYLTRGAPVRVARVESSRIVVEPIG